jgi:hypothetical protein
MNLRALFPRASKAFVLANAATLSLPAKERVDGTVAVRGKGRSMNRTESEFSVRLEAQKRAGEIQRFEYEA